MHYVLQIYNSSRKLHHVHKLMSHNIKFACADYDNVILGSDLQESPVVSVTRCSELDRDESE